MAARRAANPAGCSLSVSGASVWICVTDCVLLKINKAFHITKWRGPCQTLHKCWYRNLLGRRDDIRHILDMANLFDKLKKRAGAVRRGETLAPELVPLSEVPPGTEPAAQTVTGLEAEPGADSRREAERKAEVAGVKWRAQAEAKGEIPREIGGPKGLEPTRYGDWEKAGRCYDF